MPAPPAWPGAGPLQRERFRRPKGDTVTLPVPQRFAGLASWWDATRITGLNDNDAVAPWGHGYDSLTQGTAADRPTYQTNEFKGNPIVRLDGVSDYLTNTTFPTISSGATFFWALKLNALTAESLLWGQTAFDNTVRLKAGVNTDGSWYVNVAQDDSNRIQRTSTAGAITTGTAYVLTATYDGGTSPTGLHLFVNGVNVDGAATTQGTFTGVPSGGQTIRMGSQLFYGVFASMDVGEAGIYTTQLGTTDRQTLETYLLNKWITLLATKDLQALWDVRNLASDEVSLLWDVLNALVATDSLVLQWDVRNAIGDPLALVWDVRGTIGDTVALVWDVRNAIGDTTQLVWDVRQLATDSAVLRWDVRNLASDTVVLRWDVRNLAGDNLGLLWDVISSLTAVGKSVILVWDLRQLAGDSNQLVWDVRALATDNLTLRWDVERSGPDYSRIFLNRRRLHH